ncbi:MAG: aminotransferase class V-fold PLP-dependent enzyme [Bacteroidota bacterium]|nr:aminotransferase class V-fold PLP-dependent enzyme [Bacteroidota bacterium]
MNLNFSCPWTIEDLRHSIVGIDTTVPLLDGRIVPYVFLDNGASTPSFRHVLDVLNEFMEFYSGVHRGTGFKSILATHVFDEAHAIAGEFVGADPERDTVIFGKNTTEAINKIANRCVWEPDDVVIVTLMEHHSNDLPWRKYARVVHVGTDDEGYLDLDALTRAFRQHKGHVRFLSVTGASNITGIVNPIHDLARMAHEEGAWIFVDAAQLAPHRNIDIRPHDDPGHIDFIAYSAHKMYAPFGIGVLVGKREWFAQGNPDMVGGGVVEVVGEEYVAFSPPPAKEEAGSPNVPGAVALAAAIHVLRKAGMERIAAHEHELLTYAVPRLASVPGLHVFGPTDPEKLRGKVGVVSFGFENIHHAKVAAILSAEGGIGVRNGCFCAHPYVKRLLKITPEEDKRLTENVLKGDRRNIPGMVRASFGCYNNFSDVDRLVEMLHRIARGEYIGDYELDERSGTWWPKNFTYPFEAYFPHFSFLREPMLEGYGEAS